LCFAKFTLRVFLLKYFIQTTGLDFDFDIYIHRSLVISNLFRILEYNKKYKTMAKSQQTETKLCKQCNTTKPIEKFGIRNTGRVQGWCSSCRGKQANLSTKKADKDGVIYTITNPLGETYTGQTNMIPKYRWMMHKSAWQAKPGQYPLLHKSFDTWGFDAHIFSVVEELGGICKIELREVESNMITALKKNGKSLNVNN